MTIIYDFDGTLTPYSMPQYDILRKTKYNNDEFLKLVKKRMKDENISLYEAYYKTIENVLTESNIAFTKENICLNSDKVEFNNGVLEYFDNFQFKNTKMKHYIVTSGFEDYVKETLISKYTNGIYGTTFYSNNNKYTTIDRLMTNQYKVDTIKDIIKNENDEDIIYFGDGLTDEFAFQYVKMIGGTTCFVTDNIENNESLEILTKRKLIDKVFKINFGKSSDIYKFIESLK